MFKVVRLLILLFISCSIPFASICLAQSASIKTLEAKLKQTLPDTVRLRLLNEVSGAYNAIDPIKKFKYSTQAKTLALKLQDNRGAADAYIGIGISYSVRGLGDSAIANYKRAYTLAKQVNYLQAMGRALNNTGYAYDKMDNSRESIKCYFEALGIFKELNFVKGINQTSANIGAIYYDLGKYDLAKSYFEQCYKSYKASKDSVGLGYALLILGNCYGQTKEFNKAEDFYRQSMAIKQTQADSNGIALVYKGLGSLNTFKKNYPEALINLQKAYGMVVAIQDKYEQAAVLLDLTDVYIATGELKKAEKAALQALADSRQVKAHIGVTGSLEKLVQVYKQKKDINSAFKYQSEYITANDSLIAKKAQKDITLVEYGRVRSENVILTKDNEAIGMQNLSYAATIKSYSNLIIIYLIVLTGAALVLFLQYRRVKEKQIANKRLQQQAEEIAAINLELSKLNDIKTKFLAIISHDLRGPLGNLQILFTMFREGLLEDQELIELIGSLEDNVIATSSFLDTLLEWAKSQLDGLVINTASFNVTTYIDKNIQLLNARIQLKELKVNNMAQPEIRVLADPDMIDMVIRNLLANSVKFCNPGDEITLDAQVIGDKSLISITDNGPGISVAQQSKLFSLEQSMSQGTQGEKGNNLGLILCRDTVLQNNGRMWFDSKPGEKTTFWVELPAG